MLFPIDGEEEERKYLPDWAREAQKQPPPILKAGDRVYDILYGTKYDYMCPFGTVIKAYGLFAGQQGIFVEMDNGSECGTVATYYRLLPPEHDPKRANERTI